MISAATDDAKSIVQVKEVSADQYHSEILIDEAIDPKEADVYTQEQTDQAIDSALGNAIKVDTDKGTILIDTTVDLEVEFYTKAQVDTMYAALEARIRALENKVG